jgi:hypothetical protein
MKTFICGILFSVLAVGCAPGDGKPRVYPVTGKVTVKGKPASGARVVFYPTAPDALEKLQSFVPEDGAPEGDYKVTIVWPEPPPANAMGIFDQKDRLAGRYSNPEKSGLTAHVESGGGEIPPFDLQ